MFTNIEKQNTARDVAKHKKKKHIKCVRTYCNELLNFYRYDFSPTES